ncbi:unnamed protein product [Caenorhabditis angaria]|uniref:Metallo-beta-lactamase domain-containing protein n=1 Tax=Caenorhabditis angaria TaxID=860376 RepID=A0A9P1N9C9_9PELO|nr:unnamed protein product [Caenorhabditis angaria]
MITQLLIFFITINSIQCKALQFFIEPIQRQNPTYVQQLVQGNIERINQGMNLTSSVSLVYDAGHYIVVDSPSATDVASKEIMLQGIGANKISPGEVQYVVTTHGHPDHFGQGNFFPNARHFFGSYEYSDTNFISTELHTKDIMQLTKNVQLWNTPGHTAQDVSIIVHNVSCHGVIAVVGDLFYHEQDANEPNGVWFQEAWNPIIGKINRNKILCYANYVVPGHGKMFRVTEVMRKNSDCFTQFENEENLANLLSGSKKPFSTGNAFQLPIIFPPTPGPETITVPSTTVATQEVEDTTANFFTVDLEAETPTSIDLDDVFDLKNVQENLPPLIAKAKKSATEFQFNPENIKIPTEIKIPQEYHPIVEKVAKRLNEVIKNPQNDVNQNPQFKQWKSTLTKLWNQYFQN